LNNAASEKERTYRKIGRIMGSHSEGGNQCIRIRRLKPTNDNNDQDIVWRMLAYAAHEDTIEHVQSLPILQPYAENFGEQPGDIGMVAFVKKESKTQNNSPLIAAGAAWVRLFEEGTGFASKTRTEQQKDASVCSIQEYPELAIAVSPEFQGQGIGSLLLESLLTILRKDGTYAGVCLSCRDDNVAAKKLYEKLGFIKIAGSEQKNRVGGMSFSMKLTL
jgi:ribosomal protein S18 acetylase RimI-like enzyme